jgi:hypothetical protein
MQILRSSETAEEMHENQCGNVHASIQGCKASTLKQSTTIKATMWGLQHKSLHGVLRRLSIGITSRIQV